ncbi:hypothetical protein STEG23_028775 [Scotinomys teguina]
MTRATCGLAFVQDLQMLRTSKGLFGDSQQLRLVRILRSTVMVRVGGGWMALDEFLVKNDPCRESRKTPSRPGSRAGSKAGSRASSRRGSDASDFDISEIQSVCSDVETVPQTHRPVPRAGSRPSTAKPSKIPTPQRKSPASKLDKSSKR